MKVEALSQSNETILAVDLDGTLVNTDTLHESIIKIIRQRYLNIFLLFSWLLLGKARFKDRIARNVDINPTLLPYNKELLEWLVAEKKGGRVLVLCTAANHNIGQAVSTHLRIFDHVIASDETTNYAGRNKRLALEKLYGEKGFDYIGNSRADIPVWMGSRRAIIVNASSRLVKRVKEISEVIKIIPRKKSISPMIRALRPHQ
jgi:phosphoserine phosphatase